MNSRNDTPNVILIKVHGGLGNQLFQYALGRSLALSSRAVVKYDKSWYATQTKRAYELDHFRTVTEIASEAETTTLRQYERRPGPQHFIHNLFAANEKIYIREIDFRYDPAILTTRAPAYLDGYWQSEKYFSSIAKQLRSELRIKEEPTGKNREMIEQMRQEGAISVHVRRGDYVTEKRTNEFHGTTSIEYYQAAARHIMRRTQNPVIYVFSDDLAWAEANLHFPARTVYVSHNSPEQGYEDLRLMTHCRHHIIANSSFSWWGAWLGEHDGQIVVAPQKWFNDPAKDSSDLVPERWIRI